MATRIVCTIVNLDYCILLFVFTFEVCKLSWKKIFFQYVKKIFNFTICSNGILDCMDDRLINISYRTIKRFRVYYLFLLL